MHNFKTLRFAAFALALTCGLRSLAAAGVEFTHGPILGCPGPDRMAVWARTSRPAAMHVNYGPDADHLASRTASVTTSVDHDLTGFVVIEGLKPRTNYFYEIVIDGTE